MSVYEAETEQVRFEASLIVTVYVPALRPVGLDVVLEFDQTYAYDPVLPVTELRFIDPLVLLLQFKLYPPFVELDSVAVLIVMVLGASIV